MTHKVSEAHADLFRRTVEFMADEGAKTMVEANNRPRLSKLVFQMDAYVTANSQAGLATVRALEAACSRDFDFALKQIKRAMNHASEANNALCEIDLQLRKLRKGEAL